MAFWAIWEKKTRFKGHIFKKKKEEKNATADTGFVFCMVFCITFLYVGYEYLLFLTTF